MLHGAAPTQNLSSKPNSRVRVSLASTSQASDAALLVGQPWSEGYGTYTPISSTQSPEALRRQQEEFARAAELRQTLANLEKVDDEGRRSSLLDTLCSTEDVLGLPEHPNPPGIASGELRVDLLKHQVYEHTLS